MADVHSPETRSFNMSRIRASDTRPELLVRLGLHRRGLRFRLHDRTLPGRPDLIFGRHRAVIFVHGCFWHGHGHGCRLSKMPETRAEFWLSKITRTQMRDAAAVERLQGLGWRVLIIWECALRGKRRVPLEELLERAEQFIKSTCNWCEISACGQTSADDNGSISA